ncbi:PREDICTED: axoneme-associated protein mst101(2)-like [Branchiostoma belcheri]|uniref:Axoneme-associated protein mst101(2)-like n=1 Tax=Branchiostoma belcheri TaxID=7741 RepID=A0A6P4YQF3_BRABE|nr:PREDICTED: axoneme-associated protein mst101(2)-like [Branchiostoma belcheri]
MLNQRARDARSPPPNVLLWQKFREERDVALQREVAAKDKEALTVYKSQETIGVLKEKAQRKDEENQMLSRKVRKLEKQKRKEESQQRKAQLKLQKELEKLRKLNKKLLGDVDVLQTTVSKQKKRLQKLKKGKLKTSHEVDEFGEIDLDLEVKISDDEFTEELGGEPGRRRSRGRRWNAERRIEEGDENSSSDEGRGTAEDDNADSVSSRLGRNSAMAMHAEATKQEVSQNIARLQDILSGKIEGNVEDSMPEEYLEELRAMAGGMDLKQWWSKLTPEEREQKLKQLNKRVYKKKAKMAGILEEGASDDDSAHGKTKGSLGRRGKTGGENQPRSRKTSRNRKNSGLGDDSDGDTANGPAKSLARRKSVRGRKDETDDDLKTAGKPTRKGKGRRGGGRIGHNDSDDSDEDNLDTMSGKKLKKKMGKKGKNSDHMLDSEGEDETSVGKANRGKKGTKLPPIKNKGRPGQLGDNGDSGEDGRDEGGLGGSKGRRKAVSKEKAKEISDNAKKIEDILSGKVKVDNIEDAIPSEYLEEMKKMAGGKDLKEWWDSLDPEQREEQMQQLQRRMHHKEELRQERETGRVGVPTLSDDKVREISRTVDELQDILSGKVDVDNIEEAIPSEYLQELKKMAGGKDLKKWWDSLDPKEREEKMKHLQKRMQQKETLRLANEDMQGLDPAERQERLLAIEKEMRLQEAREAFKETAQNVAEKVGKIEDILSGRVIADNLEEAMPKDYLDELRKMAGGKDIKQWWSSLKPEEREAKMAELQRKMYQKETMDAAKEQLKGLDPVEREMRLRELQREMQMEEAKHTAREKAVRSIVQNMEAILEGAAGGNIEDVVPDHVLREMRRLAGNQDLQTWWKNLSSEEKQNLLTKFEQDIREDESLQKAIDDRVESMFRGLGGDALSPNASLPPFLRHSGLLDDVISDLTEEMVLRSGDTRNFRHRFSLGSLPPLTISLNKMGLGWGISPRIYDYNVIDHRYLGRKPRADKVMSFPLGNWVYIRERAGNSCMTRILKRSFEMHRR